MKHLTLFPEAMTLRALRDNLRDAGCNRAAEEQFLKLRQAGDLPGQLRLLSNHRRRLLERIHREERRIDCLDYLVYRLQHENTAAP